MKLSLMQPYSSLPIVLVMWLAFTAVGCGEPPKLAPQEASAGDADAGAASVEDARGDYALPADSRVANVKDFGAVGDGGRTEVIGGFIYANKNHDPDKVMFKIDDTSAMSFTVGEWVIRNQPFDLVEQTRGEETRRLEHGDAPGRGMGSMVPLFVARPPATDGAAQ